MEETVQKQIRDQNLLSINHLESRNFANTNGIWLVKAKRTAWNEILGGTEISR